MTKAFNRHLYTTYAYGNLNSRNWISVEELETWVTSHAYGNLSSRNRISVIDHIMNVSIYSLRLASTDKQAWLTWGCKYRTKLKGTCAHISECACAHISECTCPHISECACAHTSKCMCRRKCKTTHRWRIVYNAYCLRPQYINNDARRSKLSRYCSANTKM